MDVPDDDVFCIGSTRAGSLFHFLMTWGYMRDSCESPLVAIRSAKKEKSARHSVSEKACPGSSGSLVGGNVPRSSFS